MASLDDSSIIAVDKFIQATRDSGYKGTDSAIAELVDNAIQAGATQIQISIFESAERSPWPLFVSVLDDGSGMDRTTLRQALRFGGSTRFNNREGFGRYGMGLPNSSLSQARRLEVLTWRRPKNFLYSYLDVDEIASRRLREIPDPVPQEWPRWSHAPQSRSGTLIIWKHCDRLDHKRISTLVRKLSVFLGRVFRYFIWDGIQIQINGCSVQPRDPLYLADNAPLPRATLFCDPIDFEIEARTPSNQVSGIGKVKVRFSELPVHAWHGRSNDEKRELGIANGAGVSIVRSNREIDFGWFFMGRKRRENYDDWWRCEIHFDPILDEAFGITHTKQQIRPQEYLQEILTPDLENMGKALNSRIRQAHLQIQASDRVADIEKLITEKDHLLTPLPRKSLQEQFVEKFEQVVKRHPGIKSSENHQKNGAIQYKIVQDRMNSTSFYSFVSANDRFVLVLNPDHPFYRKIYQPLIDSEKQESVAMRNNLDLMLVAVARAEALAVSVKEKEAFAKLRQDWSDTLATLLNR